MEETAVTIEIDVEEMPKILQFSSGRFSESYEAERSQDYYEESEVLVVDRKSQEDLVKQLKDEKEAIIKERDEMAEEYEYEIKNIKHKNQELIEKNSELKQEVKVLFSQVENFKSKEVIMESLQKTNSELKAELGEAQKIFFDLQKSNKDLKKNVGCSGSGEFGDESMGIVKGDAEEKDKLFEKLIDIRSKYSQKVKEIDELREELMLTKLKYAESETMKNLIYKKLIDKAGDIN